MCSVGFVVWLCGGFESGGEDRLVGIVGCAGVLVGCGGVVGGMGF